MAASANINEVYEQVFKIANKSQKGGYLDSVTFNRYAKLAESDWKNDAYLKYDSGQKNWDDISALRKTPSLISLDGAGYARYPYDYWHASRVQLPFSQNGAVVPVTGVGDNVLAELLQSELTPIDSEHPVIIYYDDKFRVLPLGLNNIELSYLRRTPVPYWNYTVSSSRKVFAATGGAVVNDNMGTSFASNDVDTGSNQITLAGHPFKTGDVAFYTSNDNTTVGGLNENQQVYIIRVSSSVIALASNYTDAIGGVRINLTSTPAGETHYLANFPDILSGDSTDFVVPNFATDDLVYRICVYLGIYLRDSDVVQVSEASKNTSNG